MRSAKFLYIGIVMFVLILIVACGKVATTCNEPYIQHEVDCCLDENNNSICDNDEVPVEIIVFDDDEVFDESVINTEGIEPPWITKIEDSLGNEFYFSQYGEMRNQDYTKPIVKLGDEITFTVYSTDEDSDLIYYKYYDSDNEWTENNVWTWQVSYDDYGPSSGVTFYIKDNNDLFYYGHNYDGKVGINYRLELE